MTPRLTFPHAPIGPKGPDGGAASGLAAPTLSAAVVSLLVAAITRQIFAILALLEQMYDAWRAGLLPAAPAPSPRRARPTRHTPRHSIAPATSWEIPFLRDAPRAPADLRASKCSPVHQPSAPPAPSPHAARAPNRARRRASTCSVARPRTAIRRARPGHPLSPRARRNPPARTLMIATHARTSTARCRKTPGGNNANARL